MTNSANLQTLLSQANKYDAWTWGRVASGEPAELGATYRNYRDPEGPEALTVLTVLSVGSPLAALHDGGAAGDSHYASAGAVGAIAVPGRTDEAMPFVVASWPSGFPGVHHLSATVPATDKRWRRFERWLRSLAPDVVPVYLDRSDFDGFVSQLAEHGDVDASRLTGRYRHDQSSYSRGWPNQKSARSALEEVADAVQLRTMTLTTISSDSAEIVLRVHLRRLAGATYYSGDFDVFEQVVLNRLAVAADRRARLFRDRFRTTEYRDVRPVEVRVGVPRFEERDELAAFVDRVTRYSDSATAVLHRNPYLQLAVTDYRDGSNFDIFITSSDRITVYPGYRASVGALVRLTDFLAEEFEADGIAEEARTTPLTLADLFSASE